MCGIAGVLAFSDHPLAVRRLKPMSDALRHRGPDDAGYLVWRTGGGDGAVGGAGAALCDREFAHAHRELTAIDSAAGEQILGGDDWNLLFGHRRLSVIDLTTAAHQPMSDPTGRLWLNYNGEIYNFRELRRELEGLGHAFSSRSDTEVVIHAYQEWGIACVERFNGMFAFALWDSRRGLLHLARDRYGIKPLYLRSTGQMLVFASEIKAILAYLGTPATVDLLALNEYFSFQNCFTDRTLFDGVRMLAPGTVLTAEAGTGAITRRRCWDFDFTDESDEPAETLRDELYQRIEQAIIRHCVSDVPIGSYLSGGMDSATVAAVAARHLGRIHTFTLGFDLSEAASHEQRFDERARAEHLANLLQTEHYECVLHAGDMEPVMGDLIRALEDLRVGQCYPNYYVAKLASRFVKVVHSGTGGDELFGGYPWRYAAAIGSNREDFIANYYRYWQRLLSNSEKPAFFNAETRQRLGELREGDAVPFKDHTFTCFKRVFGRVPEAATPAEQVRQALYFECKTFLHGLLVVEDKLSMAHSLETRTPYLDNELVDFACRIPIEQKVLGIDSLKPLDENLLRKPQIYTNSSHRGKSILRRAAEQILPPIVTRAAKQGFTAPDESWFRGRAEKYIRRTLLGPDAKLNAYLNPEAVRRILDAHQSGRQNKRLVIWSLLSFETWLEEFA